MLSISIIFSGCELELEEIEDINFAEVKTGEYTGAYTYEKGEIQFVSVELLVFVENPEVTNITILEHDCGVGEKAEVIIYDVLETQSLKVDAISGATVSSNAILKSIEAALKKGLNSETV